MAVLIYIPVPYTNKQQTHKIIIPNDFLVGPTNGPTELIEERGAGHTWVGLQVSQVLHKWQEGLRGQVKCKVTPQLIYVTRNEGKWGRRKV